MMAASPGSSTRRRRPLYPFAWGSGKRAFDATYKCYSVAAAGRDDLENGDKILLPEKAFREVSRLRLEFPLTMMARNARKSGVPSQRSAARNSTHNAGRPRGNRERGQRGAKSSKSSSDPFVQYCGVLEFSSPDGVCHLPHWMMESLQLREGGRVTLRSAPRLPKGDFAKFQPHSEAFLDFASALGVRNVLELAMQHYSALAVGQTVLIQYGNDKYFLDVVEVKPGPAISLYGTVDLKVEFAPVPGSAAALQAAAEAEAEAAAAASGDVSPESESPAPSPSPRSSISNNSGPKRGQTKGPSTPARTATQGRRPRAQNIRGKQIAKKEQKNAAKERVAATAVPSPESAASINAMASKRASRLSKFKKRGSLSLNSTTNATVKNAGAAAKPEKNEPDAGAESSAKESLGRSLATGATVKFEKSSMASKGESKHEPGTGAALTATENKPTWGQGYVLSSSSPRKYEEAPTTSNKSVEPETKEPDEKEKKAFSGKGAVLGGVSASAAPAATPWAAAAKARHERYRKKKEEEEAKARAEAEAQRREAEEKCRAIAEAAAAAMSAEEKEKAARKAELEAKRIAMESQIEEKLLRDAEMKRKRQERAEAKKRAALDKAAALEAQVRDLESMALAHAVQQSLESESGRSKARRGAAGESFVEEALINAAILESASGAQQKTSTSRSSMDLVSEASKEARAGRFRPKAPEQSRRQKSLSPPEQRKKTRSANNRYGRTDGGQSGANDAGPLQKYAKQIDTLSEMGFTNTIAAAQAIEAASGDVQRAIEFLTGTFNYTTV